MKPDVRTHILKRIRIIVRLFKYKFMKNERTSGYSGTCCTHVTRMFSIWLVQPGPQGS